MADGKDSPDSSLHGHNQTPTDPLAADSLGMGNLSMSSPHSPSLLQGEGDLPSTYVLSIPDNGQGSIPGATAPSTATLPRNHSGSSQGTIRGPPNQSLLDADGRTATPAYPSQSPSRAPQGAAHGTNSHSQNEPDITAQTPYPMPGLHASSSGTENRWAMLTDAELLGFGSPPFVKLPSEPFAFSPSPEMTRRWLSPGNRVRQNAWDEAKASGTVTDLPRHVVDGSLNTYRPSAEDQAREVEEWRTLDQGYHQGSDYGQANSQYRPYAQAHHGGQPQPRGHASLPTSGNQREDGGKTQSSHGSYPPTTAGTTASAPHVAGPTPGHPLYNQVPVTRNPVAVALYSTIPEPQYNGPPTTNVGPHPTEGPTSGHQPGFGHYQGSYHDVPHMPQQASYPYSSDPYGLPQGAYYPIAPTQYQPPGNQYSGWYYPQPSGHGYQDPYQFPTTSQSAYYSNDPSGYAYQQGFPSPTYAPMQPSMPNQYMTTRPVHVGPRAGRVHGRRGAEQHRGYDNAPRPGQMEYKKKGGAGQGGGAGKQKK